MALIIGTILQYNFIMTKQQFLGPTHFFFTSPAIEDQRYTCVQVICVEQTLTQSFDIDSSHVFST